jgi:putative ABC transport system substrate-binding protein
MEGRNVQIDIRFGGSTPENAAKLARELFDLKPDIFVTVANTTVEVAKLTKAIPIVFALHGDPVGAGLVASFAHPGGNVTGFTQIDPSTVGKLVELLTELAPDVRRVGLLSQSALPALLAAFQSTAQAIGIEPVVLNIGSAMEIAPVIAQFAAVPGGGLVAGSVSGGTVLLVNRQVVMAEVARHRIPTIFGNFLYGAEGAVNYYIDNFDVIERAGGYAGLILNGANPADLPVQVPSNMLLSVNLKAAKAMGLTVPQSILSRADQVLE